MEDFELVNDYEQECGFNDMFVFKPKNPNEVAFIPTDYRVVSISFKNQTVLVRKIDSYTTLEELEKIFPDEKKP